jgi:hypothetical protein
MTLIRCLLRGFRWMLNGVTLQDLGFALLAGSGVTVFEENKLTGDGEEELNKEAVAACDLLTALALAAECPAWAGKSRGLSESFFWKEESDLDVRDRIYLL